VHRILVASLLAAPLVALPGCTWLWAAGSSSGGAAAEERARSDIREATPAIEAYRPDNGTYAGVTVSGLRTTYDVRVPDVGIVVTSRDSYCVESDVDGLAYSRNGLHAEIRPGPCPAPPATAPPARPAVANHPRTVVVVMDARLARTGSFAGLTEASLAHMVPGLRPLRVVYADRLGYCIEMTGDGYSYAARGPSGDVDVGRCGAAR
jgi:hypothetical protein